MITVVYETSTGNYVVYAETSQELENFKYEQNVYLNVFSEILYEFDIELMD